MSRSEAIRAKADADAFRYVLSDPRGRRFWNLLMEGFLGLRKSCDDANAMHQRFEGRRQAAVLIRADALKACRGLVKQADLDAIEMEFSVYRDADAQQSNPKETEDA